MWSVCVMQGLYLVCKLEIDMASELLYTLPTILHVRVVMHSSGAAILHCLSLYPGGFLVHGVVNTSVILPYFADLQGKWVL